MNKRNNISLDQRSFNRLVLYAETLENKDLINFINNFSDKGCYFVADFDEQGELSILALNNYGHPVKMFEFSVDSGLDANIISDLLFHSEQRVPDYN